MATTNWQNLACESHYQTAVGVEEALRRGDISEATAGIQELIDALSRSDKRALKSHLTRLMTHVLKWRCQPEKRSRRCRATIRNSRREIADLQEDTPSLSRAVIEAMWLDCLETAREEAEGEMNQEVAMDRLSWEEVFEANVDLK
jgi:hypothetical protein